MDAILTEVTMNKLLITYFFIFSGAILQGISMSIFLFPHSIPSGGAAGIAILINYWLHFPLGLSLWLANFIFLLFALKYFGYSWTMRTMIAVATTSMIISIISANLFLPHIHLLADLLLGGITFGVGVGLLIRNGSSSGGMVIPALMIATRFNLSPGKVMLVINLFIFVITASVIDFKIIVYAAICQLISTNIIDFIYTVKIPATTIANLSWRKK